MSPVDSIPDGIQAHDAEILTLCYSPLIPSGTSEFMDQNTTFLASGGRDRLVHIFDASVKNSEEKRYQLVTTLDSHSSSVTVSHFTSDGKKFISCSGDKTMVINSVEEARFHRVKSIPTPHGTINGFALDSATTKFAVSTGQDKRINVWNIQTGKLMRSYRPEGLNSEFYKCCVDPSGMITT
jgi:WD40 repeat protein